MGNCFSKKEEKDIKTQSSQNIYQNYNDYNPPKKINQTPKRIPSHQYYNKKNNQISRKDSYRFSNQKTRPETTIYNYKKINEYDLKKLENTYCNMLLAKASKKKTIGQGGQAKVRKYYSPIFKKTVVEKVININSSAKATLGPKGIMDSLNLLKEAILLSGFKHPNIVKIYDFKGDPPTIIMEYCAKGSLRSLLNKKINLSPLYKIYLIYCICNGLQYVHSKGIVHGDLKCDNILLSDEGSSRFPIPKLADFGLGQFHPNDVAAGTPGFIAPEIFKGSGLNFKTDIFALGMVMFEILSGLRPLPSNYELAMQFLKEGKIPCTKEVLRRAWEVRCEELLPGIKNDYCDKFYTIMIKCINDDPRKRPSITDIFPVVKVLYEILLKAAKDINDEKFNDYYY